MPLLQLVSPDRDRLHILELRNGVVVVVGGRGLLRIEHPNSDTVRSNRVV